MDRSTALVHRLKFLQVIQDLAKEDVQIASQAVGIDALETGESMEFLSKRGPDTQRYVRKHDFVTFNQQTTMKKDHLSCKSRLKSSPPVEKNGRISLYIRKWNSPRVDSPNRYHSTVDQDEIITARLFGTGTKSSNNQKKVRLPLGGRNQTYRGYATENPCNAAIANGMYEKLDLEHQQNCPVSHEHEGQRVIMTNNKQSTIRSKNSSKTHRIPEVPSIHNTAPGPNYSNDFSSTNEKCPKVSSTSVMNNTVIRVSRGPKRRVSISGLGDTGDHIISLQPNSSTSTLNTTGGGLGKFSPDIPALIPLVRHVSIHEGDVSEVENHSDRLAASTGSGRRTLVRSSSRGAKSKPKSGDPIPPAVINKVAMAMQEIGKQSDFSSLKRSEKIERLATTADQVLTKADSRPDAGTCVEKDTNANSSNFTNVEFHFGIRTESQGMSKEVNNIERLLNLDTQHNEIEMKHVIGNELVTLMGTVDKMLDDHSLIDHRHNRNFSDDKKVDNARRNPTCALYKEMKEALDNPTSEDNRELELDRIKRKLREQQRLEHETFERQSNNFEEKTVEGVATYASDRKERNELRAQQRHTRAKKNSEKRGRIPHTTISRILAQRKEHHDILVYNEKLWNSSHMSQHAFTSRVTDVLLEDLLGEVAIEFEGMMEDYVSGLVEHELQ